MIGQLARHRLVRIGIAAILLAGVATVLWAVATPAHTGTHPPDIPAVAPVGLAAPSGSPSSARPTFEAHQTSVLPRSTPVELDVPAIGVHSPLLQLGLDPDGTVQVPPLGPVSEAGWYRYSPTPGQLGPAVILGHVDSAQYGPGVFFRLRLLRPGATISVTRTDHRVARFRVDRIAEYPKDHFPTAEVYGNTDDATLRLITCGGQFDWSAGSYVDNVVVYASLVSAA